MANEIKELQSVRDRMDYEGIDYCFRDYSDFEEVEDKEFQRLRQAYVDAANALEKYLTDHTFGDEDR